MTKIGLDTPKGFVVKSLDQALKLLKSSFPVIIRPSFTLGGSVEEHLKIKKNSQK